ncbi:MAG: glycerophosphodiester phosphodiesterase [Solirubrobacterales bacterium]|nr:glycerophosphodiester phosphodiesterase [Solirubrobacterales bacterium]
MGEETKGARKPLRIGHKGADAVVPGNTLESFEAAVDIGVDVIEFDVLRDREGRLVVAHDYEDALSRRALDLSEALDAFRFAPLDKVEFDCDLKLPGREAELAGVLAGHGLVDRAMISTMEVSSLVKLRHFEPDLRLGWTFPKTRRDWTSHRWLRPALIGGLALLRRQFPKAIGERAAELGLSSVWAYHHVVTPAAVEAAHEAGVQLMAWTVDDAARLAELSAMGVHGLVSNDPRLFEQAEAVAAGAIPTPEPEEGDVMEELDEEAQP